MMTGPILRECTKDDATSGSDEVLVGIRCCSDNLHLKSEQPANGWPARRRTKWQMVEQLDSSYVRTRVPRFPNIPDDQVGFTPLPCKSGTYTEAVEYCEQRGARLCT